MKNLRILFLSFTLLLLGSAQAQYNPDKVAKKAIAAYNTAMQRAEEGALPQALQLLQEAVQKDPGYVEAYLSLGGVYGQMKAHEKSVAAYEQAFALDSNYTSDFRLPYSINLAGLGRFDKALQTIDGLLARPNLGASTRKAAEYRRKSYQLGVELSRSAAARNYVFKPENLGPGVNSSDPEYFPSLPIEGGELIFTRRVNNYNEDFFLSSQQQGTWNKAMRLNGSINTPENEGAQIIAQDGRWLVFTACNRPDGRGSCDIYISYNTPEGWSEAINMGDKINSEHWESQPCLSPDKKDLYFVSRRPGGFGGLDIYVAHLQPNGRFGPAQNMGPGFNTSGDETTPFMHADNQTFYFTSNGWPGLGEGDLFVSRREDTTWSAPQNLGYPINTINNESSLFIAADGKTAYYASNRSEGYGAEDIYRFVLPEAAQPLKTLWVKGKVFDQITGAGLPSSVDLIDLATGRPVSRVQTNENGEYLVTLPVGRDYAFTVARKGYLFYSDNFLLQQPASDSTYKKDIPLQAIEVNASMVLRNIFFDINKFDLKPSSQAELDKLVQLLQENPTVKIQIEGHTDNTGTEAENLLLSQNRAKAVVQYLTEKGIAKARLQAKGFGATKPVAANNTEAGKAQNRRTELKVIGK